MIDTVQDKFAYVVKRFSFATEEEAIKYADEHDVVAFRGARVVKDIDGPFGKAGLFWVSEVNIEAIFQGRK